MFMHTWFHKLTSLPLHEQNETVKLSLKLNETERQEADCLFNHQETYNFIQHIF